MAGSGGAQNESLTLGSVAVRTPGPVGALRGLVPSLSKETISKIYEPISCDIRRSQERGREKESQSYVPR